MASPTVLFFILLWSMEQRIYIKRRFMLMLLIYSYFYSILEIIIWTVSVWMKIIFYSSQEKFSIALFPQGGMESISKIPTARSKQSVKIIFPFFFVPTTICFAFRCGLVFAFSRANRRLALLLFYVFMAFLDCCLRHILHIC